MPAITPAITGLVLAITNSGDSSDFLSFVIADTTGDYNALTNTTGYGAPNATRAELALFIRVYNKRYDLTTRVDGLTTIVDNLLTVALKPTSATPVNTTEWTVTRNADGWQQATIYGLRLYNTTTIFIPTVGEILWDAANSLFKKIIAVLPVTGGGTYPNEYDVVTIEELEESDSYSAYRTVLNTSSIAELNDCHYLAVKNYFNVLTSESWDQYQQIEAGLKAIDYGFALQTLAGYQGAQTLVELLEGSCTCFNENCDC